MPFGSSVVTYSGHNGGIKNGTTTFAVVPFKALSNE